MIYSNVFYWSLLKMTFNNIEIYNLWRRNYNEYYIVIAIKNAYDIYKDLCGHVAFSCNDCIKAGYKDGKVCSKTLYIFSLFVGTYTYEWKQSTIILSQRTIYNNNKAFFVYVGDHRISEISFLFPFCWDLNVRVKTVHNYWKVVQTSFWPLMYGHISLCFYFLSFFVLKYSFAYIIIFYFCS